MSANNHPVCQPLTCCPGLQEAFRSGVRDATEVYISVAWARPGWALDELEAVGARVHALVGTSFGMTCPEALDRLRKLGGDTWVVPENGGPLFHPKLYLFRGNGRSSLIVGSANLTRAAFLDNIEAGVLLQLGSRDAQGWARTWDEWRDRHGVKATPRWISQYRSKWKPPHAGPLRDLMEAEDMRGAPAASVSHVVLPEVMAASWRRYEQLILEAAAKRTPNGLAMEPQTYAWTLRRTREILAGPFPAAGTLAFQQICGVWKPDPAEDCGWFGRITGAGLAKHALGHDRSLRAEVDRVLPLLRAAESDDGCMGYAQKLWDAMAERRGISIGVLSRLLTLARPDRFFSANRPSRKGMAKLVGQTAGSLEDWSGYATALATCWQTPWFRGPPPASAEARRIWEARVALLDLIVADSTAW